MRPTRRCLGLLAALLIPAALWGEPALWTWLAAGLLAVLGYDFGRARQDVALRVQREVAPSLSVNRQHRVLLHLQSSADRAVRLWVHDEAPDDCEVAGLPAWVSMAPDQEAAVAYEVTPTRRGEASFGDVVCVVVSPLGFWERKQHSGSAQVVRVYPDFAAIAGYLELLSDQRAVRVGIKKSQRRGEGLEFHQLREYRDGDTLRQIDWRATARRGELISREYEEERDQRVLFLIDSGRRMRARDASLSHFDHALNGMLLLAYVALRQGDSVGLKMFGADRRWIPPVRGVAGVNLLLNETYDVHSGWQQADYVGAAEELLVHERKRALVMLMTNLREEDADLLPALRLLRRRHVVVVANLRERVLDETLQTRPKDFDQALRLAATHDYLAERGMHQAECLRLANAVLDCTPQDLPAQVVNAYWQIKRSGKL